MNTNSAILFGAAFGDALARPFEFRKDVDAFRVPAELPAGARVTDDTQMMLALGEALVSAGVPLDPGRVAPAIADAFVAWSRSPDNDRAPGNTCMSACRALGRGVPWKQASVHGSKGCGANMRVQPVALLTGLPEDKPEVKRKRLAQRAGLAQLQAAITHGHPTALAAADLTAFAITSLAEGVCADALPGALRAYAVSQRAVYHTDWLGDLWKHAGATSAEGYIAAGWDDCLQALDRLDRALRAPDRTTDPCVFTGDGWIAEEALATGLLCFLLFPDDPRASLDRAIRTRGDSDSIACLTGAFVGAAHGPGAFPAAWYGRIEYADRLATLSEGMAHLAVYSTKDLPPFAYHRLTDTLWSGRNPLTVRDVRALADVGVTHILDLRQEKEWCAPGRYGRDAVEAMRAMGILRRNIPVPDQDAPSDAAFSAALAFCEAVWDDPRSVVFVHCRAGRERTAAVVGAVHARRSGLSFDAAVADLNAGRRVLVPMSDQADAARSWCG